MQPKYTHMRDKNNMSWTLEGRKRFVEIMQDVVKDRKTEGGKSLEALLLAEFQESYKPPKRKRKRQEGIQDTLHIPVLDDDGEEDLGSREFNVNLEEV